MMGTFGNEFWNVDPPRDQPDPRIGTGTGLLQRASGNGTSDAALALQAFIDRANAVPMGSSGTQPGGIVYLPPGTYRIRRNTTIRPDTATNFMDAVVAPDLWVKPNVLLWFAPGARLLLDPEVVVKFEGHLRAELTQIFAPDGSVAPPVPPGQRRGFVVFHSTKVPELFPEWWGATNLPTGASPDSTEALEDCLRAAHTHRFFGVRTGLNRQLFPSIPVVLSGQYAVSKELVVENPGAPSRPNETGGRERPPDPRMVAFDDYVVGGSRVLSPLQNTTGFILLGRRGTGGASTGRPSLIASASFPSPPHTVAFRQNAGRALLRIDGLQGSVIDGVGLNGNNRSSACVQITGLNAKLTVLRNCSFASARHVQAQVGDYVIEHPTESFRMTSIPLADATTEHSTIGVGAYDLSGLTFQNCTFGTGSLSTDPATAESLAHAAGVVGLVFNANQTFPMTLDHCFCDGPMLTCFEFYGGAVIIRGGNAQNQLTRREGLARGERRERPKGGAVIFIADPLLSRNTGEATPPTGVTVVEFESQSDQFLDTFRHVSASFGNVAFNPTTLQGLTARSTSAGRAPAIIFWSGPSITRPSSTTQGRGGALTLVGCTFRGPRTASELARTVGQEPAGAVVIDKEAFLVADVGTRFSPVIGSDRQIFWEFDRTAMGDRFRDPPMGDTRVFTWYRKL